MQAWAALPIQFFGGVQIASVVAIAPDALIPLTRAVAATSNTTPAPSQNEAETAAQENQQTNHQANQHAKHSATRQITTHCGQVFVAEHVIVAAGLQTPNRLARSAGLAWHNGIDVQPETLATSVAGIHALGDCISINGEVSRFIEPISRQAQTVAAHICGLDAVPFHPTRVPLRVKTGSLQFTV